MGQGVTDGSLLRDIEEFSISLATKPHPSGLWASGHLDGFYKGTEANDFICHPGLAGP